MNLRRSPELLSGHPSSTLLWIAPAMNESPAKAVDRRPIATRNRKWAQAATAWLASRNVSPNAISIAGMCACIAAGLALGLTCVEYNRVFWLCGHLFGHRKFVPNTSSNKTVGGALGAVILTTPLVAVIAHFIWTDTALDNPICLIGLGIIVSVVGQFGDLMLSSIKRDLGLKDTAKLIPGHGGLLDRFDSLILVAPLCFTTSVILSVSAPGNRSASSREADGIGTVATATSA
jgi:predicted CDP-diglyceride synthetase/phosphatidate cytidylyltransferase